MAGIKPTRVKLIDMIIAKIHTQITDEIYKYSRKDQEISQKMAKLNEQQEKKRIGAEKHDKINKEITDKINNVLVEYGYSPVTIHFEAREEWDKFRKTKTGEITPVLNFASSKSKPQKAQPTVALDKQIKELNEQRIENQKIISSLREKAREFESPYRPSDKVELRTKIVHMLCEADETVVEAVDKAARLISDKDPIELLEKMNSLTK